MSENPDLDARVEKLEEKVEEIYQKMDQILSQDSSSSSGKRFESQYKVLDNEGLLTEESREAIQDLKDRGKLKTRDIQRVWGCSTSDTARNIMAKLADEMDQIYYRDRESGHYLVWKA